MKHTFLKISGIGAAIIGAVGAFAFAPRHFANLVYAEQNGSGFTYVDAQPTPTSTFFCKGNTGTVCTFSSTATASYFRANNANSFPANNPLGTPSVTYTGSSNKLWKN